MTIEDLEENTEIEVEESQDEAEETTADTAAALFDELAAEEDSPEDKSSEEEQSSDDKESDDVAAAADGEEDQPGGEPLSAPEHWSAEDKALFDGQSDEVKDYLIARDTKTAAEFTRKTEDLATERKEREPLDILADQMAPYFATQGMNAAQGFAYLANAQAGLANGTPEQKVAALRQIAGQYGIPLTPEQASDDDDPYQDPELGNLKQQMAAMQNHMVQSQQLAATQQQQSTLQLVTDFANEKNEAGELKHPHFDKVRTIMSPLMATAGTMEKAYEQAVMANPETRKTVFDTLASQAKKIEDKDRTERVKKANKAAPSNTRSKSTPVKSNKPQTTKEVATEVWDELASA